MTSTNGKTFTDLTSIRFSMLDYFIPSFPDIVLFNCVGRSFPTFFFGVLCDAKEVCVPPTFPRSKPISLNCLHQQVARTVNLSERNHVRHRRNNRPGWAPPGSARCGTTDGARNHSPRPG